jgi:hypothetical protein
MQDIIVTIIGVIVFGSMSWKVFKLITRKPSSNDKCGGCTGCALKEKSNCTLP